MTCSTASRPGWVFTSADRPSSEPVIQMAAPVLMPSPPKIPAFRECTPRRMTCAMSGPGDTFAVSQTTSRERKEETVTPEY